MQNRSIKHINHNISINIILSNHRLIFYAIARCQCAIVGVEDAASHPVVVDLLEGLVADRALEDDALEGLALVARHQLHTDHLALTHRHVAEHLESQGNFILPG